MPPSRTPPPSSPEGRVARKFFRASAILDEFIDISCSPASLTGGRGIGRTYQMLESSAIGAERAATSSSASSMLAHRRPWAYLTMYARCRPASCRRKRALLFSKHPRATAPAFRDLKARATPKGHPDRGRSPYLAAKTGPRPRTPGLSRGPASLSPPAIRPARRRHPTHRRRPRTPPG